MSASPSDINTHHAPAVMGAVLYFNMRKTCHNVSNIGEIMGGAF
jgi:hypothetical protein